MNYEGPRKIHQITRRFWGFSHHARCDAIPRYWHMVLVDALMMVSDVFHVGMVKNVDMMVSVT